ncbi:hypothetical protein GCM10027034_27830 [Ramlibacter solisilvae]|uniref:Hemerythrin-like domain-containing protein n=1 Tax=Ramlibacter tataouinensis TaxID=94132 RepID=A0A127JR27_9BURK|nr:hemerythrin domain-containing protein [Ramlibacter tataouinensis]AMO22427.1 hypothetical protein UC35_05340 [Ramlibacter tataouinensis]
MSEDMPVVPTANRAWHAGLSVGNALLDKQHIVLFELVRSLRDAQDNLDDHAFNRALCDLLTLAQRHCAAEEHLLALNGYEWLEQHREEHLAGLDRIQSICLRRARGDLGRESACTAVAAWLEAHLVEMDLPARAYLGSSPGAAAGAGEDLSESLEVDSDSEPV